MPDFIPVIPAAPLYSNADYLAALQCLMPRGRIWPREADAVQTKLLTALTAIYARTNIRAQQLLEDIFPASTYELLPEWEATLGLPDPCAGVSPTLQARRAQVVARFFGTGGQSVPYIISYAEKLGYAISITQYTPARAGQLRAGQPVSGVAWAHAWTVNSAINTVVHARAGQLRAGDPLAYWSNQVLECELRAIAPSHTVVLFSYS